jgi:phosphocarrier protein
VKQIEVQVVNRLGLHARAAARFVKLASSFESRITASRDGSRVNGKSILGLLTLAARKGSKLQLTAEGSDAAEALTKLDLLVRGRFGEDE